MLMTEREPTGIGNKSTGFFAALKGKRVFTPWKELSRLRKILVCASGFFSFWSLLPLVKGIIGVGLYAPLFIGLFVLGAVFAWDYIVAVRHPVWNGIWITIAVIVFIGASAFAFVSGAMLKAADNPPPAQNTNVTAVVLGCKCYGDKPSKMLKKRLDAAADYLFSHPGINCIVTGGQGNDENCPEAEVMRTYLIGKGVSEGRIKVENRSTSTYENIEYTMDIIEDNHYFDTLVIITDRFHQLRAAMICDKQDIIHYSVPCETPWYLAMYYWFREMFGLARLTLLGY